MKMSRKILVITVCLLLLLSISLVSFALPVKLPQPLLRGDKGGYHYVGYASISGNIGTATFMASVIEGSVHIPPADCSCEVWVLAFNDRGERMGATNSLGGTHTTAKYEAPQAIDHTYCSYKFMGADLGGYIVLAPSSQ